MGWHEQFNAASIWPWNRAREIQHLPSRAREALWGACARRCGSGWIGALGFSLYCLISGVCVRLIDEALPYSPFVRVPFFLTVFPGIPVAWLWIVWRWTHAEVKQWMRLSSLGQRLPICLNCGYDLEEMPEDRTACPECGDPISGNPPA